MPRATEYIDEHGVKWITPARAAEIWNERVIAEYHKDKDYQNYTRFSVVHRTELQKEGDSLALPGGRLYREERIRNIPLRPHPTWRKERKKRGEKVRS